MNTTELRDLCYRAIPKPFEDLTLTPHMDEFKSHVHPLMVYTLADKHLRLEAVLRRIYACVKNPYACELTGVLNETATYRMAEWIEEVLGTTGTVPSKEEL